MSFYQFLTVLQIRFFLSQMQYTESTSSVGKVSVLTIGLLALVDAYDSFLHLSLGLTAQYMFNTFAVIALFKFILFAMLEVRSHFGNCGLFSAFLDCVAPFNC